MAKELARKTMTKQKTWVVHSPSRSSLGIQRLITFLVFFFPKKQNHSQISSLVKKVKTFLCLKGNTYKNGKNITLSNQVFTRFFCSDVFWSVVNFCCKTVYDLGFSRVMISFLRKIIELKVKSS